MLDGWFSLFVYDCDNIIVKPIHLHHNMERTSSRKMTLESHFERKGSPIMQKPNEMNSQAWEARSNKGGQWSQQLTYSNEGRKYHREPVNNSESNAVHNMFALLERCEDNLKFIAAYTMAQEQVWNSNNETDRRTEDVEMDDSASQTSACFFSDEEAIWEHVPLDGDFTAPLVAETTDDDLREALRELHEQVTETGSETDVFSERYCPDGFDLGRGGDKNCDRLPEGATVVKGDEGNEIEYAHLRPTDSDHRDQLDNLSDQDHDGEEDRFSVDMSDIEEDGYRSLSEILSEESDVEPGEIFRVRNG